MQVQKVPVQVCRTQEEVQVRKIPYTVQRPVTENITYKVPVQTCRWERQEMVRKVPVTTQRIEYEERVESTPVQVCRMATEVRKVMVPRTAGQVGALRDDAVRTAHRAHAGPGRHAGSDVRFDNDLRATRHDRAATRRRRVGHCRQQPNEPTPAQAPAGQPKDSDPTGTPSLDKTEANKPANPGADSQLHRPSRTDGKNA